MSKKKILITSGGTGGHIFPAIALGSKLKKSGFEVFYSFDARSASYVDLKAENTFVLNITNKKGSGLISKLKYLVHVMCAIIEARKIVKQIKPDLVIGFGGYATFPILFAAPLVSTAKLILHESNSVIGTVNKFFLSKVAKIAGGLSQIEDIEPRFASKFVYTGTPVREMIEKVIRRKHKNKINLLIFGGSQAAKKFSSIIPPAILKLDDDLKKKLHVIQQVKPEDIDEIKDLYTRNNISCEINSFFTDIDKKYANANLVIARSGASTISELIYLQIPSMLIPLPTSAKNHQYKNALFLTEKRGALLIEEEKLDDKKLSSEIELIIKNQNLYEANLEKLHVDAGKKLVTLVKDVLAAK